MTRWSLVLCIALAGCIGADAPADQEAAPADPDDPAQPEGPDAMATETVAETTRWAEDQVAGDWSQAGPEWILERAPADDGLLQAFADGRAAHLFIDGADVGEMTITAWSIAGDGDAITETVTFAPA